MILWVASDTFKMFGEGANYPTIQGFDGTTPLEHLRAQYLSGSTASGSATVYLTDNGAADGNPMFSAIHNVTVTPVSTSNLFGAIQSLSTDLKTLVFSIPGATVSTPYTIAVFGEP